MILSIGQQSVLDKLKPIAKLALDKQPFMKMPVHPRTHTLVCGPSGVGKSHLCRALGEIVGVEVLVINCSSWAVLASKAEPHTLDVITRFVHNNPSGIIVLDEIDKIAGDSNWLGYIRLEIHDLLDAIIPHSVDIPHKSKTKEEEEADFWCSDSMTTEETQAYKKELETRLKNHFLIVGAGAWQHLWDKRSKPDLGFLPTQTPASTAPTQAELQSSLYPEIQRRFRSEILVIPPMSEADYVASAKVISATFTSAQQQYFRRQFDEGVSQAVEMKLGMRWFEELILNTLLQPEPTITHAPDPQ